MNEIISRIAAAAGISEETALEAVTIIPHHYITHSVLVNVDVLRSRARLHALAHKLPTVLDTQAFHGLHKPRSRPDALAPGGWVGADQRQSQ